MKKILISLILIIGVLPATVAQTDNRTRETRIADIVMQLPARSTAAFNRIMGELFEIEDAIRDLAPQLADPGGDDEQIRYAIAGLAMYASKDASLQSKVAQSISSAIPKVKSDEIRDFLFIQLQFVAGYESVETAAQYLNNARLADAAARVLINIGTDEAGRALLNALSAATGRQQLTIVQALGDMSYRPAYEAVKALAVSNDANLRKVALHYLAMVANPTSERLLADAARSAGFRFELTNALGSYILFLENSLPTNANMVRTSAQRMLRATNESTQIAAKTAALELLSLSAGEGAIPDVIRALRSNNKQYRMAALDFSANIESPKMYNDLMRAATRERRTEVKAEIISAFGNRGDKTALPFVLQSLSDNNVIVRTAAIVTASKLGGADAVAPIVSAMNTNDEQVITIGRNMLLSMAGEQVENEVVTAIPQATSLAKVAFLEILASRRATAHSEAIFTQTSVNDAAVRLATFRALASVAEVKDVPRIAQLLNNASNNEDIAALQRALFAAVSSQNQDRQTDLVLEQLMRSNNPVVYANVAAMIGGQKALDLVMSEGFYSSNATFRDAAFNALLNWSDGLAAPQLFRIASSDIGGNYFDRALTAYVSIAARSNNTPEQRLLLLRNALDIAQTSAQKQNILRQIARTNTFAGMMTAGKYLDDSNADVQQAAVQTVRAIALANPQFYGQEIVVLLNKAMAVNRDPEAEYQRQAVAKHISEMPAGEGFISLFNGKDLTGWQGLVGNPISRARMTPSQLAERQAAANEIMRRDWTVKDGILIFDGPGYDNLTTIRDFGDIEMYIDWRLFEKGDAGVYLRGSPQIQMWDTGLTEVGGEVGSGGLYNNQRHPSIPLVVADNPTGEWNSFYIRMIGDKVTVYLNGQLVTDNVTLENFWSRTMPMFETGAIELQAHTTRTEYRSIYVREIPRAEPFRVSEAEKTEGFVPMFNGNDMTGWIGNLNSYFAQDGTIICDPSRTGGSGGNLYTEKEYADFVMRFEFMLTPAANNGIGIRTPLIGDPAFAGMEIQILDNEAPVYRNLRDYQYHGSVYGVIPAKRGYLRPVGEWNEQEIVAIGNRITVTLNGTVILDGDIREASNNFTETIGGYNHPGLSNKSGHIALLGHGSWVAFRNMRIRDLSER
jgi:HEAT repeat protein